MALLITGGLGYIGSHTVLQLIEDGFTDIVIVDNLSNASRRTKEQIELIANHSVYFYEIDLRDKIALDSVFMKHSIKTIFHFAALKAVGDSVLEPNKYHQNNIYGTLCLLEMASKHNVFEFIFSSSATVYGSNSIPYSEDMPLIESSSPYGSTKIFIERILVEEAAVNTKLKIVSLRYFNPIGAHKSHMIGENPKGTPNNLVPIVSQVAVGNIPYVDIFGDDYSTKDGTCERDFIHVTDVAEGHVSALNWMRRTGDARGHNSFNLGTGRTASVLEIINMFSETSGCEIPYRSSPRRPGDLPCFWASIDKAEKVLGWSAKRDLRMMIKDSWEWQLLFPDGL